MKKTKRTKTASRPVRVSKSSKYDPHKSPVIQGGVVFLIVAAMALLAYTFKRYMP